MPNKYRFNISKTNGAKGFLIASLLVLLGVIIITGNIKESPNDESVARAQESQIEEPKIFNESFENLDNSLGEVPVEEIQFDSMFAEDVEIEIVILEESNWN